MLPQYFWNPEQYQVTLLLRDLHEQVECVQTCQHLSQDRNCHPLAPQFCPGAGDSSTLTFPSGVDSLMFVDQQGICVVW